MSHIPGVILAVQFKQAQTGNYYAEGLNYADREEAKKSQNGYHKYQDYMANQTKSSGLFHAFSDALLDQEKKFYQQKFADAGEKGGLLWQPIISFDNKWLEDVEIIKDGVVDDQKIKKATKLAMTQLLKKEKMLGNVYWIAAIHYNTDNIHLHISMVEKKVMRARGMFKQSHIDLAKSKIVAEFLNRTEAQKEINHLMRDQIISNAKEQSYQKQFKKQFKKISDMNKLQYGRLSKEEKKEVDQLTHLILKKQFPQTYAQLQSKLNQETFIYKRAYGEGEHQLYQRYQVNKEQELMSKIGNTEYKDEETQKAFQNKSKRFRKKGNQIKRQIEQDRAFFLFKKIHQQVEKESQKAISEYEEMMKGASYER